jgi:hypothetical protein
MFTQRGIKKIHEKIISSKCFTMDGSKIANKPFIGFTSIDTSGGISWKFRIAKIASTFTAEALAVGETLETIEKIDSEQNFVIYSDSENMLKGISNTSMMNNASHITKMLKYKIDWNHEGKNSILLDPRAL